jgi:hypothetical protein
MGALPATAELPRRGWGPRYHITEVLEVGHDENPVLVNVVAGPYFDLVEAWEVALAYRRRFPKSRYVAGEMRLLGNTTARF